MSRISAWFDRHMKTRIALQLALDGLPVLMSSFVFALIIIELDELQPVPEWVDAAAIGMMYFLMYGGGAGIYVLAIWLRIRAKVEFACYPGCGIASGILQALSFIPAVLSLGFLVGIIITRIQYL